MRTNAMGLRGPQIPDNPPPDTVRILSLGESTTFGAFVAEEETYTARLAVKLNEQLQEHPVDGIAAVETINAAVEAWSIWQSRVWLEDVGRSLKPDVILVYHQLNDTLPTGVRDQANFLYQVRQTDRHQLMRRRAWAPLFSILLRSRAYLALRKQVLRLPSDLPTPQQSTGTAVGERVPEQDRKDALKDMHALAVDMGAELVLLRPQYAAAPHLLRDTVLTDFAERNELLLVDIPAHLRQHRMRGVRLYSDGVHPTPAGHEMYADAIAQTIIEAKLLERITP